MWADSRIHPRSLRERTGEDRRRGRRKCGFMSGADREGCQRRVTHMGMCRGLAMTCGCEWHMRRWVKRGRA